MKNAVVKVECVSIFCPSCGENIDNDDNGSYLYTIHDSRMVPGMVLECSCGVKSKVPHAIESLYVRTR